MTQHPDRCTKVLLALLVLGVWGLLLRPVAQVLPAEAQSRPLKQYGVCSVNNEGKVSINGAGFIGLNANELQTAFQLVPKSGWRVHSVLPGAGGMSAYVVIVEK